MRNLYSWVGLLVAVVLLVAINVFASAAFRSTRVDLTEQKLYTLSKGTRNILSSIEEPVDLTLYYSQRLATETAPQLDAYATRVRELLEEYRDGSGGKLRLKVVDPQPFSEEEDAAALAGLQGVPVNQAGDALFFGLVAKNSVDETANVPFFSMDREAFLEYDLSRIVSDLTATKKTVVGLMTELPVDGDRDPMAAMRNPEGAKQPWVLFQQLRELHDIREVSTGAESIDEDISVLMVVHPKNLSDATLYAIDQFVLKGGRLMVFVDPHCESEQPPADPQNPYSALWADRSSDMPKLLENWGVKLEEKKFVGDRKTARRISVRNDRGIAEPVDYVGYHGLTAEEMDQQDVATANVGDVTLGIPGGFSLVEGRTTEVTPVVQSSKDSMLVDVEKIKFSPQPAELIKEFEPGGESVPMVVRIGGKARSAFPEGRIAEGDEPKEGHVEEAEDIKVLAYADVDFMTDRFWVQVQNFFGQRMAIPISNNPALVMNAIENFSGSDDLISVRSRGNTTRDFKRVVEIAKAAETKFRDRESELQARIQEIEGKLNEIRATQDESGKTSLFLTPEQEKAIEDYQTERVNARKELRNVRFELQKDIDSLGNTVKVLNIGAIPIAVALFAVVLGVVRINRRRS